MSHRLAQLSELAADCASLERRQTAGGTLWWGARALRVVLAHLVGPIPSVEMIQIITASGNVTDRGPGQPPSFPGTVTSSRPVWERGQADSYRATEPGRRGHAVPGRSAEERSSD